MNQWQEEHYWRRQAKPARASRESNSMYAERNTLRKMPKCDIYKKEFSPEFLREHWGRGKKIKICSKSYRVGRMSYGDYFFEPTLTKKEKKKYYGETKPFHPKTLWLEKKLIKNKFGTNQVVYNVGWELGS